MYVLPTEIIYNDIANQLSGVKQEAFKKHKYKFIPLINIALNKCIYGSTAQL